MAWKKSPTILKIAGDFHINNDCLIADCLYDTGDEPSIVTLTYL